MEKSLETREKMAESTRKRWEGMSDEEVLEVKRNVSLAMKRYWESKTQEEKRNRAVKAAATRKLNLQRKRGGN